MHAGHLAPDVSPNPGSPAHRCTGTSASQAQSTRSALRIKASTTRLRFSTSSSHVAPTTTCYSQACPKLVARKHPAHGQPSSLPLPYQNGEDPPCLEQKGVKLQSNKMKRSLHVMRCHCLSGSAWRPSSKPSSKPHLWTGLQGHSYARQALPCKLHPHRGTDTLRTIKVNTLPLFTYFFILVKYTKFATLTILASLTLTMLCNHHQHVFPKFSSSQTETLSPLSNNSPPPLPPAPGNL